MSVTNVHTKSFKFKWHFNANGFGMELSDINLS